MVSLGTMTTVVGATVGSSGWIVMVAGSLGINVVGLASAGKVKVVTSSGTDSWGNEVEAEGIVTVNDASGSKVVPGGGTEDVSSSFGQ